MKRFVRFNVVNVVDKPTGGEYTRQLHAIYRTDQSSVPLVDVKENPW